MQAVANQLAAMPARMLRATVRALAEVDADQLALLRDRAVEATELKSPVERARTFMRDLQHVRVDAADTDALGQVGGTT